MDMVINSISSFISKDLISNMISNGTVSDLVLTATGLKDNIGVTKEIWVGNYCITIRVH